MKELLCEAGYYIFICFSLYITSFRVGSNRTASSLILESSFISTMQVLL